MSLSSVSPGIRTLAVIGLHSASLFWVVSLLARFCTPTAVGYYVFGFAVSAPVIMFLNFRMRLVLANDVGSVDHTWAFVRFRAATCALAFFGITVVSLLWMGATERTAIVVLVGATKAVEAMSDICWGGLQRLRVAGVVERSIILRSLSTLAVTSVLIPLTQSAVIACTAVLLIWTLQLLLDLVRLHQWCPLSRTQPLSLDYFWNTVKQFASLGLTALLVSVAYNVPRFFIAGQSPENDLGYYGVIAYFGLVIGMVATAATETYVPSITQRHRHNLGDGSYLADVRRIYAVIAGFGLLSMMLSLLFGEMALSLLFGPAYAEHLGAFMVIQLAAILGGLAYCQAHAVIALKLFSLQLKAAITAFLLLIAVSAWLVPRYNIFGAAVADLIYAAFYFALIEWIIHTGSRRQEVL